MNLVGDSSQGSLLDPLSKREVEILRLLAEGYSNGEIAQKLYIAPETVKWYNKQIFSKLFMVEMEKLLSVYLQPAHLATVSIWQLKHQE